MLCNLINEESPLRQEIQAIEFESAKREHHKPMHSERIYYEGSK